MAHGPHVRRAPAKRSASRWPPVVFLPVATAVWLVVAVLAWRGVLAGRS